MNKAIFKFASVTYAFNAREIVQKNGGTAVLRRNPRPLKNEGCGYVLTVSGNIDRIINLFDINRIKYISIEMVK